MLPLLILTSRCQGTRSATGKMIEFKKGAFSVAAKEGSSVVPITLDGTGRLMRNGAPPAARPPAAAPHASAAGKEGLLYPGKVVITVHPPIPAGDADAMCAAAQKAVESALEPRWRA